jgi:hypothetical protein
MWTNNNNVDNERKTNNKQWVQSDSGRVVVIFMFNIVTWFPRTLFVTILNDSRRFLNKLNSEFINNIHECTQRQLAKVTRGFSVAKDSACTTETHAQLYCQSNVYREQGVPFVSVQPDRPPAITLPLINVLVLNDLLRLLPQQLVVQRARAHATKQRTCSELAGNW